MAESKLDGPLYSPPSGKSLGPTEVGGPKGPKQHPDPLGFNKTDGGKK